VDDAKTPTNRRRLRTILLALAALVIAGAGAGVYMIFFQGDALRAWVRTQVEAIAATYLNPELTFEDFQYTYPRTVTIYDLKLTSRTPDLPRGELDIMHIRKMTLTLAEIPKVNQPIRIEKIRLDRPEWRLVVDKPGGTEFYGYSNMLRRQTDRRPGEPPVKLSDVFQIRLIEMLDGLIVYDTRDGQSEPMILDGLNTSMKLEDPTDGWHALNLAIDRQPVFALTVDGRLYLDTMIIETRPLTLEAQVSRANDRHLPPQLQQLLREYQVEGKLIAAVDGQVHLQNPDATQLNAKVSLTDATTVFDKYVVPIDSLDLAARVAPASTELKLTVNTLEGVITSDAAVTGDQHLTLDVYFDGPRLEKTLVRDAASGDKPFDYAGKLDGAITLTGPLAQIGEQAGGSGELKLTEGRLVQLPVASQLARAGKAAAKLGGGAGGAKYSDRATLRFDFAGDRVRFTEIDAQTTALAVRGTGTMGFDTSLDLKLNGGPIEKVQAALGKAGKILGKVTDSLMSYKVTGTLAEPKVGVSVLGAREGAEDKLDAVTGVVDEIVGQEKVEQGVRDAIEDVLR
jgi:uncharacterized protein involved in outer membrane biogenesis